MTQEIFILHKQIDDTAHFLKLIIYYFDTDAIQTMAEFAKSV